MCSTKDSMAFLKKEYRILSKIAPLKVALNRWISFKTGNTPFGSGISKKVLRSRASPLAITLHVRAPLA